MDLVASCKEKLSYFRIKELKDVLTQLGLSKQGKKQDLVDRILAILSNEQVAGMWAQKSAVRKEEAAKLVDDIYRKMQGSGANDLASKMETLSDTSNVKLKEEVEDSCKPEKIRCPCGSLLPSESMIKCEDPRCHVWQHINCVIIPEKPMEGVLPMPPDLFYCELCRLSRADPFLVTIAHPLYPVKLIITSVPADGGKDKKQGALKSSFPMFFSSVLREKSLKLQEMDIRLMENYYSHINVGRWYLIRHKMGKLLISKARDCYKT